MILHLIHFLCFFALCTTAQLSIDNGVKGSPSIDCSTQSVTVNFETDKPFQGHIYVRGHYLDDKCHKDYILNKDNFGSMKIPFDTCGMRRHRRSSPKGMAMASTVIITFHRTFVTSVDKAYNIECFYMEADKSASQDLSVSEIPTVPLTLNPPMPECTYEVLTGGPEGTPVKFSRVGDKVYHKWSCKHGMQELYCMVIHSCFVDDGSNSAFELIDDKGCSKDPVILENLSYITDLMAGTEANVFKFADKSQVYFQCQVRLSLKHEHENEMCPRPQCGLYRYLRFHRNVDINLLNSTQNVFFKRREFDLTAAPLLVLDLDDDSSINAAKIGSESLSAKLLINPKSKVCLSYYTFGVLGASCTVVLLTTMVLFASYCYRRRENKG